MAYTEKVLMDLSQDRLEGLLNERLNARGNKDKQDHIDQRIWDLFGEEWCILFTDLSGFSKHAKEFGIIQLIQTIKESERIFSPIIENYDGFVVKTEGDTLIVIFRSRKKAIKCAIDLQNLSKNYNEGKASEDHIILCCGLGWGKILRVPGLKVDIFGEEVNFSAKLGEDTANGGEILITNNLAENFPEMEGVELIEHGYLSNGGMPIFKAIY
jgi:adenylate cyclase|tara:strand:+ start:308 stop:946 length:639 start_codon:yes stop_codon:yes gene_type:complete